ncbi:MAG: hypothetical protein ABGX60_03405, partial [Candidatus Thioglobus sp.]
MIKFISLLLFIALPVQALQLLQSKEGNNTVKQRLEESADEQSLSAKQLHTQLRKSAKSGDARSQFSLANMYHKGMNVKQDVKLAFYWYTQVAEQGYATAQFNLA